MVLIKMEINFKLFSIFEFIFLFRSCVRKLSKRDAIARPMAYKLHLAGLRPVTMCLGKLFIIRNYMYEIFEGKTLNFFSYFRLQKWYESGLGRQMEQLFERFGI